MATAGSTHDVVLGGYGYVLASQAKNFVVSTTEPTRTAYLTEAETMAGTAPAGIDGLDGPILDLRRIYFEDWRGIGQAFYSAKENAGQVHALDRLRPIARGKALSPVPQERVYSDATVATSNYFGSFRLGNNLYIWRDAQIYLMQTSGGLFTGYISSGMPAAFPNPITDVFVWYGNAYIATGANYYFWNGVAAPTAIGTPVNYILRDYQDIEMQAASSTLKWIIASTTFTRDMGANINCLLHSYNAVWIGTDNAIWRLTGNLKAGSPGSAPQNLNLFEPDIVKIYSVSQSQTDSTAPQQRNFYQMQAFAGYLWFWANGRIYRARPTTGNNTLTAEAQPIRGSFRGMAVCDGLLVVCVANAAHTQVFAWQTEPEGWFRLGGQLLSVNRYYSAPFCGLPQVTDGAVMTFSQNKSAIIRWPLDNRYASGNNPTNHGLSTLNVMGTVVLPIITPQDLAEYAGLGQGKIGWVRPVRIGVEWGVVLTDSAASVEWADLDAVQSQYKFQAEISMDGGSSWTLLYNANGQGQHFPALTDGWNGKASFNIQRSAPTGVEFDIDPHSMAGQSGAAGIHQRYGWQFRVKHTGPYGPAIRRIWLDFEVSPLRAYTGRQWQITVDLNDKPGKLTLDDQPDIQLSYDPAAWANLLLLHWQQGKALDFVDLVGNNYRVKVTGVEVIRSSPGYRPTAPGGLKPEFVVKMQLTEIFE